MLCVLSKGSLYYLFLRCQSSPKTGRTYQKFKLQANLEHSLCSFLVNFDLNIRNDVIKQVLKCLLFLYVSKLGTFARILLQNSNKRKMNPVSFIER